MALGYARRDKQIDEGPGLDLPSDPGPSMRSACGRLCAVSLCLPALALSSVWGEGIGVARGAELSALQLRTVRGAGAPVPAL